jgi:hypothetical protein
MAPACCRSRWSGACSRRSPPRCGRVVAQPSSNRHQLVVELRAPCGRVAALPSWASWVRVVAMARSASWWQAALLRRGPLALPAQLLGSCWRTLGPQTMTDLRRHKPQTGALTSRRWPNRSTVPNLAAGTPSRSKHSVGTIQCGHVPTRNTCATHRPRPEANRKTASAAAGGSEPRDQVDGGTRITAPKGYDSSPCLSAVQFHPNRMAGVDLRLTRFMARTMVRMAARTAIRGV